MDSSTIASIIIAIIAALASTVSLYFTYYTTRRSEERAIRAELNKQLNKYSQPLLIAAFDFQARLYELVDIPISRRALECDEGHEDLFIFTCYRMARFLASSYILRESTHFLSMRSASSQTPQTRLWQRKTTPGRSPSQQQRSTDEEKSIHATSPKPPTQPPTLALDDSTSLLRDLLYKIDDELDRRRDAHGTNYGVFPGARLLIAERMLIRPSPGSDTPDTAPIQIKDWNTFLREWETLFRDPCSWFKTWLETLIAQRQAGILDNPKLKAVTGQQRRHDDHFRCLQHLLCDLVTYCDLRRLYNSAGAGAYRKCRPSLDCDCTGCGDTPVEVRHGERMGDRDLAEEME